MKVVGICGSLRRNGLSEHILGDILGALAAAGHQTQSIFIAGEDIRGCVACLACEKTGKCIQAPDRTDEILNTVIPSADFIVVSSPIYFTGVPWKLKAIIDRVQVYWARRAKLGGASPAKGASAVVLVGGSSPEKHFDGPARVIRSALKELGFPCKWLGVFPQAETRSAEDARYFAENAAAEILALAQKGGR